jgi:hypothetical protein
LTPSPTIITVCPATCSAHDLELLGRQHVGDDFIDAKRFTHFTRGSGAIARQQDQPMTMTAPRYGALGRRDRGSGFGDCIHDMSAPRVNQEMR